jgi:hypothetical protein
MKLAEMKVVGTALSVMAVPGLDPGTATTAIEVQGFHDFDKTNWWLPVFLRACVGLDKAASENQGELLSDRIEIDRLGHSDSGPRLPRNVGGHAQKSIFWLQPIEFIESGLDFQLWPPGLTH